MYEKLIKEMTVFEKASLMSGKDVWRSRSIDRLKVPQMAMADGPHGLRKQASEGDHLGLVKGVEATCFPTSATMANSWDVALCEEVGAALGYEAAFHEVNLILGPGLNIKRNPLCGRNFEYYSEDPYLSGKLAGAYTRGIQSNGVGACLKHFAANNQEYLRMTNDSIVDERTLHEIYLTGFEIAVKEGQPKAVMTSYNKINGVYANENSYLLKQVLVDDWGFNGMVVSDWGGGNDAVEGVRAGAHLEMPTPGLDSVYQIEDAVRAGVLDEGILDQRVDEFLQVLYDVQIDQGRSLDHEAHHRLAAKAAEQSAVLLKNQGVLPLKEGTSTALIGDFAQTPRYQGAGSSQVNPYRVDSMEDVIKDTDLVFAGYAKGYNRDEKPSEALVAEAVALAKKSDVAIVCLGLNEVNEMEGHDRAHMIVAQNQIELLSAVAKAAPKTVAVISGGSAIEMPWENQCDGILHTYLSGQAGAKGVMNLLTGVSNPCGKLTESYPLRYEDCPNVRYYPGAELTSEYREGLYVGYRYYDKSEVPVRYPFGYGLSYTTFDYSDLVVEEDCIRCQIKNSGPVAGAEIIQLYIGKDQKHIDRAVKELKGFCKVYLEPGEKADIVIPFDAYSFRYYDIVEHAYRIESGDYTIMVGSSSQDIRLTDQVSREGKQPKSMDMALLKPYFLGDVADVNKETFERLYGKALPEAKWDRNKKLDMNDSLVQMQYAKSMLARLAIKILIGLRNRSYKKGKPDLNLFFLTNMPFRAIAKMSDGMFSMKMIESVVTIVNGRFVKGLSDLIRSWKVYRKRGKTSV